MITIKITDDKNLNIKADKYSQPVTKYGQTPLIVMNQVLYNGLHRIAEDLGTTIDADSDSGVDPITLLTDMLFYGPEQCTERFFKHATVKKWIRTEDPKHVSDVACVLQWSGHILGGVWCDQFWSAFNALKAYVYKNWSKSKRNEFWSLID